MAELVLTLNAFQFEDKFFLQIKGTAMGTRMAPSYANLFMGKVGHRDPSVAFLVLTIGPAPHLRPARSEKWRLPMLDQYTLGVR